MRITDVKVRQTENCGNMKANADVTFDNEITVKEMKVMNGVNGYFVAMPSRKGNDGKYRDLVYIEKEETKKDVSAQVLEAYRKLLNRQ